MLRCVEHFPSECSCVPHAILRKNTILLHSPDCCFDSGTALSPERFL
jgi:hypothetical protein